MQKKRQEEEGKFRESRFFDYFHLLVEEIERIKTFGIRFIFVQTPLCQNINNLSSFEKLRLAEWEFDFNHISEQDCQIIKEIYSFDTEQEYLKQVYDGCKIYEMDGIKYLADFRSKYVNVLNGKRITYYHPMKYFNKIYVYGQCTARGTGVEDKETIQSFLQKIINKKYPDCYRVVNSAIGNGSDVHDDIAHMKQTDFKSGDIVVLCTNLEIVPTDLFREYGIDYFDSSNLFDRPHNYGEWFTDSTFHTNARGNRVIAKYIMDILEEKKFLASKSQSMAVNTTNTSEGQEVSVEEVMISHEEDLNEYLASLFPYQKLDAYNGCIVMNCNPFTKGHRYLIEKAAQEVDNLYVFVVEENRSFFPYEERLNLVKQGTERIDNVIVLPSGKFIISAITFPGYFYKDGNKEIKVNPALDLRIFGKYIAKTLNIKIRYAGEEPLDFVTRTYNENMQEILPQYGMRFVEIPRKEQDGEVISASLVRKLLKEKDFETIEKLVPKTTYDYLRKRYD